MTDPTPSVSELLRKRADDHGGDKLLTEAADELDALQRELAEARADRDHFQKLACGEVLLEEMHVVNGRIDARFATDMAMIMARTYLDLCDHHGAQNYLEISMNDKRGRGVIVTVQKADRPTPHQLRQAAEASLADARRDAERYRWLRTHFRYDTWDKHRLDWYLPRRTPATSEGLDAHLDSAIDAAMGATHG